MVLLWTTVVSTTDCGTIAHTIAAFLYKQHTIPQLPRPHVYHVVNCYHIQINNTIIIQYCNENQALSIIEHTRSLILIQLQLVLSPPSAVRFTQNLLSTFLWPDLLSRDHPLPQWSYCSACLAIFYHFFLTMCPSQSHFTLLCSFSSTEYLWLCQAELSLLLLPFQCSVICVIHSTELTQLFTFQPGLNTLVRASCSTYYTSRYANSSSNENAPIWL